MSQTSAPHIEIFHGSAANNLAYVYARCEPPRAGCALVGTLHGPHCLHSTTLPATLTFRDQGPGESLLALAKLPDPCFWSPEMPALYTASLELRCGEEILAGVSSNFGIRAFGPRGKFFYEQGKRFVIRGQRYSGERDAALDLLAWHDSPAAMLVANPDDALCEEASRAGVLLIAEVASETSRFEEELRRLACHAAVAIIAVRGTLAIEKAWRKLAPNVVLARMLRRGELPPPGDQGEALIAEVDEPAQFAARFAGTSQPIIAYRPLDETVDLESARAASDQLQAALAPHGDFAGYLV